MQHRTSNVSVTQSRTGQTKRHTQFRLADGAGEPQRPHPSLPRRPIAHLKHKSVEITSGGDDGEGRRLFVYCVPWKAAGATAALP
jgi:hypothetical protein